MISMRLIESMREIGLEVEVGIEHVGRVAGAVAHDAEHGGEQRVAPEHLGRGAATAAGGAATALVSVTAIVAGGKLDVGHANVETLGSRTEVAEHHVALGRHDLPQAVQVLAHGCLRVSSACAAPASERRGGEPGTGVGVAQATFDGVARAGHDVTAVDQPAGGGERQGGQVDHRRPTVEQRGGANRDTGRQPARRGPAGAGGHRRRPTRRRRPRGGGDRRGCGEPAG